MRDASPRSLATSGSRRASWARSRSGPTRPSWSVFNQTVCALRFLYGTTLQQPATIEHIPFPRQPKTLPVVLSRAELARFFTAIPNRKHRTVLMTMYAAGLRLSEALRLRVADVDSARQCLRVEQGKGQKDRYTLLSPTLLEQLRGYWRLTRPAPWLFPGRRPDQPLTATAIQRGCGPAARRAGLAKRVSTHTMRHNADCRIMPSLATPVL